MNAPRHARPIAGRYGERFEIFRRFFIYRSKITTSLLRDDFIIITKSGEVISKAYENIFKYVCMNKSDATLFR